jgi:hypothetical protein
MRATPAAAVETGACRIVNIKSGAWVDSARLKVQDVCQDNTFSMVWRDARSA